MGVCETVSKTMPVSIRDGDQLFHLALEVLKNFKIEPWEFRGIGIHLGQGFTKILILTKSA